MGTFFLSGGGGEGEGGKREIAGPKVNVIEMMKCLLARERKEEEEEEEEEGEVEEEKEEGEVEEGGTIKLNNTSSRHVHL